MPKPPFLGSGRKHTENTRKTRLTRFGYCTKSVQMV